MSSPTPNPNSQRLRVLVVEDHADTAKAMSRLLRALGYEVEVAHLMADAQRAGASGAFDLLISDIALPDGSGLELMRYLQAVRPIKGIALSGYGAAADVESSKQAGFSVHLIKPIDFTRLRQVIEEVALV